MTTQEIANKLVAHCRKAEWEAAQKSLYSPGAVSIEPYDTPEFPKETKGLDAIIKKGHMFSSMVEKSHGIEVSDPIVAGNSIAFKMTMDVTMKGKGRMKSDELCVYEVKDGKIVSEQFFV
jgi:hypothetical protein